MNYRSQHCLARHYPVRRQAGVTLVESLLVLAIAAVTLGAVAPGFETARELRQLEGAAAQFETDVHFVRSLALAHNRTLRMNFSAGAAGSCYVVHTGAANECNCTGDGTVACADTVQAYRSVHFERTSPVQMRANVHSILFDPHQGTSSPTGTLRITGRGGATIHAMVSLMGRVRNCAPAPGLPGLPGC